VPAGQGLAEDIPIEEQTVPTGHLRQVDLEMAFCVALKVPLGQGEG
jgi:hypothetical protein